MGGVLAAGCLGAGGGTFGGLNGLVVEADGVKLGQGRGGAGDDVVGVCGALDPAVADEGLGRQGGVPAAGFAVDPCV